MSGWERDSRWWWGWHLDCLVIGIRWQDGGIYHVRGILLGPIQVYWEKWDT